MLGRRLPLLGALGHPVIFLGDLEQLLFVLTTPVPASIELRPAGLESPLSAPARRSAHLQQLANMIAIRHLLYAVAHVAPPVNGRHILVAIIDVRPKLRLLLHAVQS